MITVVNDQDMPVLLEYPSFKVDFVMGSSSVIKSNTPGQVMEAVHGLEASVRRDNDHSALHFCDDEAESISSVIRRGKVSIYSIGSLHDPVISTNGFPCKCLFGVIRLMQSALFQVYDKVHSTRKICSTRMHSPRVGKSTSGSVTLGEIEIQQMAGTGYRILIVIALLVLLLLLVLASY